MKYNKRNIIRCADDNCPLNPKKCEQEIEMPTFERYAQKELVNAPIIEFKNEAQVYEYLKEWQTRLFLDDWIIKIELSDEPIICDGKECSAMHNTEYSIKTSVITFYTKAYEENRISKHAAEHSLVHELLHLKYSMYHFENETIQDIEYRESTHMLIEQMAKSLIMAKYNLSFDWFKNF